MNTLFVFLTIITIIDCIYRKFLFKEEEVEQISYPSTEILEQDKRRIKEYLKTKKYRLTHSLTLDDKENQNITEERTYPIYFRNERRKNGKASIIIDNSGDIKLIDLKILNRYSNSKSVPKSKTYDELLVENIKYKSQLKEIQKMLRDVLKKI